VTFDVKDNAVEHESPVPDERSFINNPYPLLAKIRAASPVAVMTDSEGLPVRIITRYKDAKAVLADPRFRQDARRAQALARRTVAGASFGAEVTHMLNSDPPDHTRLRSVVLGSFTATRVKEMRHKLEQVAAGLADDLAQRETADVVSDFALPFSLTVICHLLGLPLTDRILFRKWSTMVLTGGPDDFSQAYADMTVYFDSLIKERHGSSQEDLLSLLVQGNAAGLLTGHEVTSMMLLLLIGGHETTVNLLGTAVLALLNNPGELSWLRANPAAMPAAIHEFVRWESPICMTTLRFTTEPVAVSGVEIPAEELVMVSLGAANHDPQRFADPDRLNLRRNDTGHLGFGHGLHRCLGAFLGQMEAEVALSAFLRRIRRIRLAADPASLTWRDTIMLRGLESLPVEFPPTVGGRSAA
jgi:cytochrome P450